MHVGKAWQGRYRELSKALKGYCVIYALVDPIDKEIRYVGMTTNLYMRLTQHRTSVFQGTPKSRWIGLLEKAGLGPEVRVLDMVLSTDQRYGHCDECRFLEKLWQQRLRRNGCRLLNSTLTALTAWDVRQFYGSK